MNKDRSKKIKDIVQKSIDERTKILGKRHYGHFVNEDEDKKKKDKKGKKPHHGVPPPPPSVNSPFENAISASYGGTEEGGSGVIADQDATDFILYAGITDPNQQLAIEDLVSDLKAAEIWDKFYCLYPFVGNVEATCKYNLKDPRDEDDAFRLTFHGAGPGVTFSETGVQPNGSTGYANTHFTPTGDADDVHDFSIFYYSRTNDAAATCDFGAYTLTSYCLIYPTSTNNFRMGDGSIWVNSPVANTAAFIGMSRTSNTSLKAYVNGVYLDPPGETTTPAGVGVAAPLILFARGTFGVPDHGASAREQAFASIGDGLTEAEVADFYAIVQDFQTTLGRAV